jgi:hypothetical protein
MLAGPVGEVGVKWCNTAFLCHAPTVGVKTGCWLVSWVAAVMAFEHGDMLVLGEDLGVPAVSGALGICHVRGGVVGGGRGCGGVGSNDGQ